MIVLNKTHYWHELSKFYNVVPYAHSFASESARRDSCYLRMHFEFEYTKKVNGQCFYLTFTYNDKSVPKFDKYNVFNYDHIRLITNGVLSKRLIRDYGSKLKYFCSCESGDGGTVDHHRRGIGNNPHYHFVFFVQPANSEYIRIDPLEFKAICQEVWQGKRGYFPWKYARFGSVKQGKFGISVVDSRALRYVSKYVTKDTKQIEIESYISNIIYSQCCKRIHDDYFHRLYAEHKLSDGVPVIETLKEFDYSSSVDTKYSRSFLEKYRYWFNTEILPDLYKVELDKFKNKHSGKVRCSKSLGQYGLSFVKDPDSDPHFLIDEKKGPKVYKLPLYYNRKLYFDTFICPHTGNLLYVLNDRGKALRLVTLSSDISHLYNRVIKEFKFVLDNDIKFLFKNEFFDSVSYARSLYLSSDFLSLCYKYAVYNKVYRYRIYNSGSGILLSDSFLFSDIISDYDHFLDLDRFHIDFEEQSIKCLYSRYPSSRDFSLNPVFYPFIYTFDFIDSLLDSVSDIRSESKKREFKDTSFFLKNINAYEHSIS